MPSPSKDDVKRFALGILLGSPTGTTTDMFAMLGVPRPILDELVQEGEGLHPQGEADRPRDVGSHVLPGEAATTFSFKCRRKKFSFATLAECSAAYSAEREASGLGASQFREVVVAKDGVPFARISYNGRVWAGLEYVPDAVPLYDNRSPR